MSEHFIKDIEIKNFKCFDNFKAEGFGRVNLIGGKNNVGKTAFMEAVYVNGHADNLEYLIASLYEIVYIRNYLEYVTDDAPTVSKALDELKRYSTRSNIRSASFKVKTKNAKKRYYFFDDKREKGDFSEDADDYDSKGDIKFIDNYGFNNHQLNRVYTSVQLKNKEQVLNEYIQQFDSTIKFFKIIKDKPKCQIGDEEYRNLSEFGDGLKDYISIICSLYACENGYLFIDEIDNGIHYTQLDKLWEIILTISQQQNVQVFATTHSKECIESYARVAKKLEDEEIGFIQLGRNKRNELDSIVMNSERFQRFIELGNEVRGW